MLLSVVIPTRNRAVLLDKCLASLKYQNLSKDKFEVVVVNNGSTDDTKNVIRSHMEHLNLVSCFEDEPGLHNGRHAGARKAQADVLVYADDDIQALPGWLESLVSIFEDPAVAIAGGNNLPNFEITPPRWLQKWWSTPVAQGKVIGPLSISDLGQGRFEIDPGFIWGCNFSIRRSVLADAGGFHPDAVPANKLRFRGDGETHISDFVRRNKLKSMFDSGASIQHMVSEERMTREYLCARAYAQGISDSYTNVRKAGSPPGKRENFRLLTTQLKQQIKNIIHRSSAPEDSDLRILGEHRRKMQTAYWQGYRFHQDECRRDDSLMKWVTRSDYW